MTQGERIFADQQPLEHKDATLRIGLARSTYRTRERNETREESDHGRFWKNNTTRPDTMTITMSGSASLSTLGCGTVPLRSG